MMNPFEELKLQNFDYVESGAGLTFSADGGFYLKVANGWMLRLKLWAPVNFLPDPDKESRFTDLHKRLCESWFWFLVS